VEAASTAAAAREVAEGDDSTVAAIAAPGVVNLYQLEVLKENVSQIEASKTRSYVVVLSGDGFEKVLKRI